MRKIVYLIVLLSAVALIAGTYSVVLNKTVTVTRTDTSATFSLGYSTYADMAFITTGSDSLQIAYFVDALYQTIGGDKIWVNVETDTLDAGAKYATYVMRKGETTNEVPATELFRVRTITSVEADSSADMGFTVKLTTR